MPSIADSVTFPHCGLTAPTATLKSAMTERECGYDHEHPENRGKVTPEYIKTYEEWGKGKIGVIVLGNSTLSTFLSLVCEYLLCPSELK